MLDDLALQGCSITRVDPETACFVLDSASYSPGRHAGLIDIENPVLPAGGTLLKLARQRFVARVPAKGGQGSVVFKIFPLHNWASRLRYRKYALTEFANLREAQRRGVPVPAPLAYLEKRRFRLVVATGLVIEDLPGWSDAREGDDPLTAAKRACGPLVTLWQAGCLHIDARDENILFAPAGGEYRIIDWQYASFHRKKAPWLLEHLAAEYIKKSMSQDRRALVEHWLPQLAERACLPLDEWEGFIDRVAALLRQSPSIRAKLANKPARGFA